jgi:negative regulator of sigma E activity
LERTGQLETGGTARLIERSCADLRIRKGVWNVKKLQLLSTVAAAVLLTAGVCAAQTSGKEETSKVPQATSDQSKSGTMGHEKSEKSQAAQEKSQAAESANEKEESRTGAQEKRGESSQGERKESATSKDKSKAARDDKNETGTEKQSGAADRMKGQHHD